MQIYYTLSQAGDSGLTVDEVINQVHDKLPAGYVWRTYQAHLEAVRKRDARRRSATLTRTKREGSTVPTLAERARATRYVVSKALDNLTRVDSEGVRAAIRRPDARYVVGLRIPRAMKGLEGKYDESGDVTRKAVTTMELVRIARPVLENFRQRRAAGRKLQTLSVELGVALERWFEAHAVKP